MATALPAHAKDKPIEVWFQDEARVGQKGGHAYIWAPIGSRPPMVRDNRHTSAYLFGAICPQRAVGAGLVMPYANAYAMNEHLKEISAHVATGAHALLLYDGAGWHQTGGKLKVPDNITVMLIPPYCPELNPMENVWQYLRQNQLATLVWQSYDAIVDACVRAWNFLANDPTRIRSIGNREWACVSK
jgi:DDE superfamily endonuclease